MIKGLNLVFDAGPIIHLSELDTLSILDIFPNKIITEIIYKEVSHYINTKEDIKYIDNNFTIYKLSDCEMDNKIFTVANSFMLNYGEISAFRIINKIRSNKEIIFASDDSASRTELLQII